MSIHPIIQERNMREKLKKAGYGVVIFGGVTTVVARDLMPGSLFSTILLFAFIAFTVFVMAWGAIEAISMNMSYSEDAKTERWERREEARLLRKKNWEHGYANRTAKQAQLQLARSKYGRTNPFPFSFSFERTIYDYSQPWSAKHKAKQDKWLAKKEKKNA